MRFPGAYTISSEFMEKQEVFCRNCVRFLESDLPRKGFDLTNEQGGIISNKTNSEWGLSEMLLLKVRPLYDTQQTLWLAMYANPLAVFAYSRL